MDVRRAVAVPVRESSSNAEAMTTGSTTTGAGAFWAAAAPLTNSMISDIFQDMDSTSIFQSV